MSSVPLRQSEGNDVIILSIDYSLRGNYNKLMFEAKEIQQLDVDGNLVSRVNQLFELSKRAISLGVDLVIEEARDPEIRSYISRQMDRFNGVVDRTKKGDDIQFQRTVKIDVATFPAIVKAAKELGYI